MTTPEIITPTIGRKVWYRHDGGQTLDINGGQVNVVSYGDQPMDATVIYVWHDRMVNLRITDHAGNTFALSSVNLVQQGDATPVYRHCEWMPYQKGQAAKAETGEKAPAPKTAMSGAVVAQEAVVELTARAYTQLNAAAPWGEIQAGAGSRWEHGKAPRVTKEMVEDQIVGETYTVLPSGRVTVCELTLKNGFTVRGESAVVFIENNVPQTGREIARKNAVDQIWPLLGFRLRDEWAD